MLKIITIALFLLSTSALADKSKALTDARFVIYQGNSHFTIDKIREGSRYHSAGFKNGDVILKICGKQEKVASKILNLMRELITERTCEISVRRGEENLTLTLGVDAP